MACCRQSSEEAACLKHQKSNTPSLCLLGGKHFHVLAPWLQTFSCLRQVNSSNNGCVFWSNTGVVSLGLQPQLRFHHLGTTSQLPITTQTSSCYICHAIITQSTATCKDTFKELLFCPKHKKCTFFFWFLSSFWWSLCCHRDRNYNNWTAHAIWVPRNKTWLIHAEL